MENRLWKYISWIIIGILLISMGYGIGFSKGFANGIKFAIRVGLDFVEIDIDEERMLQLINLYQQYCDQEQVAKCLDDLRIKVNISLKS